MSRLFGVLIKQSSFYFIRLRKRMGRGKWPVLHDKSTVTSRHRSVHAPPLSVPTDSLDIHLLSCYEHNQEIFPDNTDTVRHPSRLHSHELQHKVTTGVGDECPSYTFIRGGVQVRPSIHSVKLGIGANHIAQTIAGFSRKADGTFYNL